MQFPRLSLATVPLQDVQAVGQSIVPVSYADSGCCYNTVRTGLPMSANVFVCLLVARLFPDGRVEYRTDPDWFTPYMRRETVEWEPSSGPVPQTIFSVMIHKQF